MSNINNIVEGEDIKFITAKEQKVFEEKGKLTKKILSVILAEIVIVLAVGLGLGFSDFVFFFIAFSFLLLEGVAWFFIERFLDSKLWKKRLKLENEGRYFSARVKKIEKYKENKYVVCACYEENSILKEWTSDKYKVDPSLFISEGANCILISDGEHVILDRKQAKKTVFFGDWVEYYSENIDGKVDEIPEEQRLREWVGEGPDPTLAKANIVNEKIIVNNESTVNNNSNAIGDNLKKDALLDHGQNGFAQKNQIYEKLLKKGRILRFVWIFLTVFVILDFLIIAVKPAGLSDYFLIFLFILGIVLFCISLFMGNLIAKNYSKEKLLAYADDWNVKETDYYISNWVDYYNKKVNRLSSKIKRYENSNFYNSKAPNGNRLTILIIIIAVMSIILGTVAPLLVKTKDIDLEKYAFLLFITVVIMVGFIAGIFYVATARIRYKRNLEKLKSLKKNYPKMIAENKYSSINNFYEAEKLEKIKAKKKKEKSRR